MTGLGATGTRPVEGSELSQTEHEMLESRRQAERRARMFQHLSSMPANDNVAAPIPLAGDELQRRAIPEDLSIPEFLNRTPAPAPKSPTSSETPTLQEVVKQTEQLRGAATPANDNLAAPITPVDGLPELLMTPAHPATCSLT